MSPLYLSLACCFWAICFLTATSSNPSQSTVASYDYISYSHLMPITHRTFDDILSSSPDGIDLARHIKHAEHTVQDLVALVEGSNLTVKDALVKTLSGFASDAEESSRDLRLFADNVHALVDSVLASNARLMREYNLANEHGHSDATHAALGRTFWQSMDTVSPQMLRLTADASAAADKLNKLEDHLMTVNALCIKESIALADAQDGFASWLWTILGGSEELLLELRHRQALQVLAKVQEDRSVMVGVVAAIEHTVMAVEVELSVSREWLMSSDGWATALPLEIQLEIFEHGFHRLARTLARSRDDVGTQGGRSDE
ncbi:hypothetical protein C8Q78DRAFT_973790 [Trametes maxima]|nr:hypothetical protein C8Q78DRAFT_973790 [Trametes maxima]